MVLNKFCNEYDGKLFECDIQHYMAVKLSQYRSALEFTKQ